MMSKEQALTVAVNRYVITMPVYAMLEILRQDMLEHFMKHASDEEVEAFLLDFGPDNAPKGAH